MAPGAVVVPDAAPSFKENVTAYWSRAFQPRVEFYKSVIESRHSSVKASSETLLQIREERSVIKAQHALLNECENALLPVSRLAPEILAHVFHFLAEDLPLVPQNSETNYISLNKSWTAVLFVSRYFRRTALGDPSLWPTVTTALGPNWMNRLVDLSGSTYITFHLGYRCNKMGNSVRSALLKIIGRLRTLRVATDSKGLLALELPPLEMPHLESIRFYMDYDEDDTDSMDGEMQAPLWNSDILVRARMPELRKLSVHGFGEFPWTSSLLQPTLTSLHIGIDAGMLEEIVELPPLNAFLSAISRLPNLTELSLARCKVSLVPHGTTPVQLLNLRTFDVVECDYMTTVHLFAHIQAPPDAKLYFFTDLERFNYPPTDGPLMPAWSLDPTFFQTLKRQFATPAWQNMHTVEYMTRPEDFPEMYPDKGHGYARHIKRAFVINAWRLGDSRLVCADCERVTRPPRLGHYDQLYEYVRYERPEPNLSICLGFGSRQPFRFIDECLGLFSDAHPVHTLSLRFDHESLMLGNWHRYLQGFVNLRFLRVDGITGQDILERLYTLGIDRKRMLHSSPPLSQPLPELKTIALLRDGEDVQWRSSPSVDTCSTRLELLAKVWELRAENGVPLEEVVLDERRVALSHFQPIRQTVNIRSVHLWNFGYGETIVSEHEDDDDESDDDDPYGPF